MTDHRTSALPADPVEAFSRVVRADEPARAARAAVVERKQPADLAEILERVLNTGIVIAGEIRVDLLDIELLTIKIRLVITSLDRAEEVGLDWWRNDPWYSGSKAVADADTNQFISTGSSSGTMSNDEAALSEGNEDTAQRPDNDSTEPSDDAPSRDAGRNDHGNPSASASMYAEEVVALSQSVAQPNTRRSATRSDESNAASTTSQPRTQTSAAEEPAASEKATKKTASRKESATKKKSAAKKKSPAKKAAAKKKTATKKAAAKKTR